MISNSKYIFYIFTFMAFAALAIIPQNVSATSADGGAAPAEAGGQPGDMPPGETPNEAKGIKDTVTFKGEDFKRSNYMNMSKIFWLFEMPDLSNNEDIDIFFQINECELYEKYYGDEFEWGPLREVMRDYLKKNRETFSRRIYFDLPIEVGIYNVEAGNFGVESKNFNSGQRDFFPHPTYVGWNKDFCGFKRMDTRLKTVYPREALFRFIRPLTIPHIKVQEEVAKELVQKWKDTDAEHRYLAIRMYLTITKFMGFQDFKNQKSLPVYLSYINGFEIYENLEMERLLYTKSYKKKTKKSKPKLSPNGATAPDPDDVTGDDEDDYEDEDYDGQ